MDRSSAENVQEKVFIQIIEFKKSPSVWSKEDVLEEMKELVSACGAETVGSGYCRVDKPTPSHLISNSALDELKMSAQACAADLVIFSYGLKGVQLRNIEKDLEIKTIDRTQLILDIFARHAKSREGKIQVELAQLEYLLPRLVGKGQEMSRLGGGIGTLGPGETKLEMDRRRIRDRIVALKKDLQSVVRERALQRKKRKDKGVPAVTLVGYTNAGKSTLINSLTDCQTVTHDGLFTTLDSLSRRLVLPNNQTVVISDTVGFMQELPHDLIEAFKATLEEVTEADVLLHVLDASRINCRDYYDAVIEVLKDLGAEDKPTLIVLNKMDKEDDKNRLAQLQARFDNAVCVSALKGENLEALLSRVIEMLSALFVEINVNIPIGRMDLVGLVHEQGEVFSIKYYNQEINIRAMIPRNLEGKFRKA